MVTNFAHKQYQHTPLRRNDEDLPHARIPERAATLPGLVSLQRYVGNSGIQRLMNSTAIRQRAGGEMLHRKGCGCSSCSGKGEDEHISRKMDGSIIQRDDESWLDQATDFVGEVTGLNNVGEKVGEVVGGVRDTVNQGIDAVTGAVSDAANWAGEQWDNATGGGSANGQSETTGGVVQDIADKATESIGGGKESNWWDDAVSTVSSWLDGEDAAQEAKGIGGVVQDIVEKIEESIEDAEQNENETDEAGSGMAICNGTIPVGHGGGSSGGVSVSGLTTANFAAATATSSFTPSQITPTGKNTYDVTGTETIDYSIPTPTISYNVSPKPLSDCKQQKVDAFIAGDLGAHEKQHQDTFKNTYDGQESFSHTFSGIVAANSAELTAKIQAEEKKLNATRVVARQAKAQGASDKLDVPAWNKPIPGIDSCKD